GGALGVTQMTQRQLRHTPPSRLTPAPTFPAAPVTRSAPVTRRHVLGAGAALAAASLAGCDLSTDPAGGSGGGAGDKGRTDKEAPMLAKLVKSGDLPPVEDRLPESPMEIEPVKELGVYGGSWQSVLLGAADTALLTRTIGYEPPLRWHPQWEGTIPNLAESVEASADGRE